MLRWEAEDRCPFFVIPPPPLPTDRRLMQIGAGGDGGSACPRVPLRTTDRRHPAAVAAASAACFVRVVASVGAPSLSAPSPSRWDRHRGRRNGTEVERECFRVRRGF